MRYARNCRKAAEAVFIYRLRKWNGKAEVVQVPERKRGGGRRSNRKEEVLVW